MNDGSYLVFCVLSGFMFTWIGIEIGKGYKKEGLGWVVGLILALIVNLTLGFSLGFIKT